MKKILFTLSVSLICFCVYGQKMPEMVTVAGGTFDMGSNNGQPNEKPVHTVTVSSFRMAKYVVTVADFAVFATATGYKTDAEKKNNSCVYYKNPQEWHWINSVNWRDDETGKIRNDSDWDMPVIHVSWNDAMAYCQWLSKATGKAFRLPTEAEYEYAAGNGVRHTTYSWGNGMPCKGCMVGNVRDESTNTQYGKWGQPKFTGYNDGYFFSSPVGCYIPNDFGLYDMTGNVWEWCSDKYDEKYYAVSPAVNPKGPARGRNHVFRGGSWHSNPTHCQVTYRYSGSPDNRTPNLSFRVVSSL